ncbi:MAG: ABC transporter permease [Eubacteriaceae bacterium]
MKIFDILNLALLNLYRRLSRTFLTVIGVVIGTACIVIMISIGLTNLAQFDVMIENSDLTIIVVSNMENIEEDSSSNIRLDASAVESFSNIDNVDIIIPQKNISMYAKVNKYYAPYLSIIAVPADSLSDLIEIEKGHMLNPESSMIQIVMGEGVGRNFILSEDDYYSRNYKGPELDWLKTPIDLYLGGKDFFDNPDMPASRKYRANIVGIIQSEEVQGEEFGEEEYLNSDIYISLESAKKIIEENYRLAKELNIKTNTYDTVLIYADEMDNVKEILKTVRSYGFQANSNTEWIEDMQSQQRSQQGQLAAIGLVSLIVSAIGIANTMMTSILERKKEIGVMKVIGVSINKIRSLFLVESALIGMIGGIVGVLISHLIGYMLSTGGENINFLGMSGGMKLIIPIWLDVASLGIAILVGVISGVLPTRSITRMSPIEAIRGN